MVMILLYSKIVLTLVVSIPNLILTFKIITRPHIHSLFNSSLACFFAIGAIFGPAMFIFTIELTDQMYADKGNLQAWITACSHYLEVKHLLAETLKIISSNIMFRFFFIVYAERGLVSKGILNTKLFNICFVVLTLALTFSGYFSYRISKAQELDYPQNTIVGRICLNLRLDWDRNDSKKTKDIYIKVQILVAALTLSWGSFYAFMIRRVSVFIPRMCLNNTHQSCLGGRYRRNILTFKELSIYLLFIISQFIIGNILIFILYGIQDIIEQGGVFFTYFGYVLIFDTFHLIIIPLAILVRSRSNYPLIWSNYRPKKIKFWCNLSECIEPFHRTKNAEQESPSCSNFLTIRKRREEFAVGLPTLVSVTGLAEFYERNKNTGPHIVSETLTEVQC